MVETKVLDVPLIRCGGCAESISTVVRSLPGVADVAVDIARKRVAVTFDPGSTSLDAIRAQIRLAGF